MASEFQRRKMAGVFQAMDADGDGCLDQADFAALAARWIAVRGAQPGSPDHARLTAVMTGWWDVLRAAADRNGDGRVTIEEVLVVVDRLSTMPQAVVGTAEAMFDAVDADRDGHISAAEYRTLIEAWNGVPADTDEVFAVLDLDGDGRLAAAEFTRLWIQFWAGDDPDEPGTWVFGRFELPVPR